jgi:Uma2 family endonuclease
MDDSPLLSAEEFADRKFDLPEGGRWAELVAGRVVVLEGPDEAHGTVILNLSKALAAYLHEHAEQGGYACFSSGLVVARGPDTVRFPPLCYFAGDDRFAEADKLITESVPAFVVEVASTADRRRAMTERVEELLAWGVELVWVADTREKQVHVLQRTRPARMFAEHRQLSASPVLTDFWVRAGDLFAVPAWWKT